jgi:ferredoxin-type protein NapH
VENPIVRAGFVILLFGSMFLLQMRGVKLPFLPYLVVLSVVVSLFFQEVLWHRRICPFGTILSVTSRLALRGMRNDLESCINCGACEQVCPTDCIAVSAVNQGKRAIMQNECVGCYACEQVCPVYAAGYGKI